MQPSGCIFFLGTATFKIYYLAEYLHNGKLVQSEYSTTFTGCITTVWGGFCQEHPVHCTYTKREVPL